MTFEEIKALDQHYIMHSYGRVAVALEKGSNATAWDTDGKEYIDFTSGIGVNSLGFADKAWVEAVSKQLGEIQHVSNYYYQPKNIELAQKLAELSGMKKSFFCNSGAEANECAIKISRKHGAAKAADKIITLSQSFHGRTITTLAATGQEDFHKDFLPLTKGFIYAQPNDMDSVKAVFDDRVCAVMIELIQGEGGVVPLEKDFVTELSALCREKGCLLVIDEVQTGIGRTGNVFSYQKYGIQPDIVSCAKGLGGGLPIGVCLVSESCEDVLQPGMHGSTFGGNPAVAAGALEVLNRVSSQEFLRDVKKKGEYIRSELLGMSEVKSVYGDGLMLGAELKDREAKDVLLACAGNGLLVLTAKSRLRFLPPLTISYEEINKGLDILRSVLK